MNREKVMEKIRGLLALGDSSRNPESMEAEAALLKAHELMAKYNISVETSECKEEIEYATEICNSKWNMGFRKPLGVVIAQNFRCKVYVRGGDGGGITFFGRAADARVAREVFEFAYNVAMKGGNRCYNERYKMGLSTKGVFNSYVQGFIVGLQKKLEVQSTALMVVTPPDVDEKFNDLSKAFKKGSGGIRNNDGIDTNAYSQGKQDGESLINQRRLESK